jgi:hypothetical protein
MFNNKNKKKPLDEMNFVNYYNMFIKCICIVFFYNTHNIIFLI